MVSSRYEDIKLMFSKIISRADPQIIIELQIDKLEISIIESEIDK